MKHLLLILLSLSFLASPARADDTITAWSWSSVLGAFEAKLTGGTKVVPDQQVVTQTNVTLTPNSGTCVDTYGYTVAWVKTGHLLSASGVAGCSTLTGTVTSLTMAIPNGWTCAAGASGTITDYWGSGTLCKWTAQNTSASSTNVLLTFVSSSIAGTSVTAGGSCWLNFHCYTTN